MEACLRRVLITIHYFVVGISRFPLWACDVANIDTLTLTLFNGDKKQLHIVKDGEYFQYLNNDIIQL